MRRRVKDLATLCAIIAWSVAATSTLYYWHADAEMLAQRRAAQWHGPFALPYGTWPTYHVVVPLKLGVALGLFASMLAATARWHRRVSMGPASTAVTPSPPA